MKWEEDIHKPGGEDQEEPILGCFGLQPPGPREVRSVVETVLLSIAVKTT